MSALAARYPRRAADRNGGQFGADVQHIAAFNDPVA